MFLIFIILFRRFQYLRVYFPNWRFPQISSALSSAPKRRRSFERSWKTKGKHIYIYICLAQLIVHEVKMPLNIHNNQSVLLPIQHIRLNPTLALEIYLPSLITSATFLPAYPVFGHPHHFLPFIAKTIPEIQPKPRFICHPWFWPIYVPFPFY